MTTSGERERGATSRTASERRDARWRRSTRVTAAALLGATAWAAAPTEQAAAQETRIVRGVVVDSGSRAPIAGVYIFASETETLAHTGDDGSFEIRLNAGPQRLVLSRVGYGESEVTIDPAEGERVTIGLEAVPEQLPGLEVEGRSFQARIDSINDLLDRSANGERMYQGFGARGVPRFANVEKIRPYDDASDPTFAFGALGVSLNLMDDFCGVRVMGANVSPTIFLDGQKQNFLGCDRFREMEVSEICRMELIPFPRSFERRNDPRRFAAEGSASYDLYVWSCRFLAQVATGDAAIPDIFDVVVPVWWTVGGRSP